MLKLIPASLVTVGLLALVAGVLCCGCGGRARSAASPAVADGSPQPGVLATIQPGAAASPGRLPALAAPSRIRRASAIVVNVLNGAAYDPAASQHLAVAGTNGDFAPAWTPQSPSRGSLAYGLYALQPDVASVAPVLHAAWRTAPAAGECWVGLGDFSLDRWTWRQWPAGQDIALDLAAKNINSQTGVVPVVILLAGSSAAQLGRLRIGANQAPTAVLTLTAPAGPAPLSLAADAGGSADADGVITQYEYDLDGDGNYDQTTAQPTMAWQQGQDGSYACFVRVTDDDGATAVKGAAYDSGYHRCWKTPKGPTGVTFTGVAAIPGGGYYATGYAILAAAGTKSDAVLLQYDAGGNLAWARSIGTAGGVDYGAAVAVAPDGSAYSAGVMSIVGGSGLLLLAHYFPDGALDWQRSWGGTNVYPRAGLAVDGASGDVYLSTMLAVPALQHQAVLQRYTATGTWQWTRTWGDAEEDYSAGNALDALGNSYLGVTHQVGTYLRCGVLEFDAGGAQLAKIEAGSAGFGLQGNAIAVNSTGGVALCGEYMDPSTFGPFVIALDPGFSQRWACYLPNAAGNEDSFAAARYSPFDGRLWLCGGLSDQPDNQAGLMWFNTTGTVSQFFRFHTPGSNDNFTGLSIASDNSTLAAGSIGGPTVFDPQPRSVLPLTYTLSVPALDAQPYILVPQTSTFASVPAVGDDTSPDGGTVFKFYAPQDTN